MRKKIDTVHLREKSEKRECFFVVVFKKMQATKEDIEKLQTGLDDLRYF